MIKILSLLRVTGAFALLAMLAFAPARAAVLAELTSGTGNVNISPTAVFGQSFTVSGAGSFTNIAFNFFSNHSPATTPSAGGTGFLLSTAYAGTPAALSSGTPGFLGSAAAAGGFYGFGSSVTLLGGTQYLFYSNGATPVTGGNGYVGGLVYYSENGVPFEPIPADANFRVTGDVVGSVPDAGATIAMLGAAFAGLIGLRRRLA